MKKERGGGVADDWQGIYVLPLFPRKFHYDNNVLPSLLPSGSLSTVAAHAKATCYLATSTRSPMQALAQRPEEHHARAATSQHDT